MAKNEVNDAQHTEHTENAASATVPQEEYQKLYDQAVSLDARYRKLTIAYNNLLELYLSGK